MQGDPVAGPREDKVNEQLAKCSVTVTLDWDPGAGPVGENGTELLVLADACTSCTDNG